MKYRPKRLRRLDRVWLNHGQPTYFITIRAAGRGNTLGNDAVHKRLREFLHATAAHHDWWATRYVLMPDHLHLFATPGLDAVTLGAWIKALKACVANREFRWQTGFFDHALRSSESQSEKWEYIRQNPVREGLVAEADKWPFGGEIDWAQGDVQHPPRQETRPTSLTGLGVGVASRSVKILRYDGDASDQSLMDAVAAEEPLEIRVEGHSLAVVMRTPGHDRELAAGFLLTENLVRAASDIFDITQCGAGDDENVVNVTLRDPASFDPAKLTRHVFSSSSCGVCSKATLAAVRQVFPAVDDDCFLAGETLFKLPARLREKQEAFAQTGGLHACALFDLAGNVQAVREDVGRHNALDKLIGRALLENRLPLRAQVLLLSGRVSFEMMQKALAASIPIIAAISAPTSLAIEFARENKQTLVGFLRGETMNVYAGAQRIISTAAM